MSGATLIDSAIASAPPTNSSEDDGAQRDDELRGDLGSVRWVALAAVEIQRLQLFVGGVAAALDGAGRVGEVGEDEEHRRDDPGEVGQRERTDDEADRHDREEEVQVTPGGLRIDLDAVVLLSAVPECDRRARDEQHGDRPEQERSADDRPDRDLDRLRVTGITDQSDHGDDRLRQRRPDGRQDRADRARPEVQPVPEPLDGVREADRAAHDEHERREQLESDDHAPGLPAGPVGVPSPAMATADLTVIALGREDVSASGYIAEIQRRLAAQDRVRYALHAMGTSLEGTTEDILEVVGELHAVPFEQGAPRVYTVLKLDDRRDREQTLEDKVASVREQL